MSADGAASGTWRFYKHFREDMESNMVETPSSGEIYGAALSFLLFVDQFSGDYFTGDLGLYTQLVPAAGSGKGKRAKFKVVSAKKTGKKR